MTGINLPLSHPKVYQEGYIQGIPPRVYQEGIYTGVSHLGYTRGV